ncbi:MAG: PIN domain-containing protein [Acidobacteria bacterium]|nr:PIN domain-containing protein [Acidobacteriota bacterium]
MRAVVDTNILVRAMLNPGGSVGPVVDFLRDGRYVFLYSEATLNEMIDVLSRPRMVHRYGITAWSLRLFPSGTMRKKCCGSV